MIRNNFFEQREKVAFYGSQFVSNFVIQFRYRFFDGNPGIDRRRRGKKANTP